MMIRVLALAALAGCASGVTPVERTTYTCADMPQIIARIEAGVAAPTTSPEREQIVRKALADAQAWYAENCE